MTEDEFNEIIDQENRSGLSALDPEFYTNKMRLRSRFPSSMVQLLPMESNLTLSQITVCTNRGVFSRVVSS